MTAVERECDCIGSATGLILHRDTQTWTLIVHGVRHTLTAQEYLDIKHLLKDY